EGDDVTEVLGFLQYDHRWLVEKVRRAVEDATRRGDMTLEDSARLRKRYKQGLQDYTYLTRDGME
ncbi:MAG: hypothetical protein IT373_25165, partial [Polyangiaceae bacterium]|nr:hypothetical protein [Polyangiaceae bacterium]